MKPPQQAPVRAERICGLLLGELVGDALGLPYEGMSRRRTARFAAHGLKHRFFFGRGMMSDDSEHAFFAAQALLAHPNDSEAFARALGWKLRGWLLGIPAGAGFATLRAILKLWIGFGPARSGVRSAGNGPAMRSPAIGAFFGERREAMERFVAASTRLTHTDSRAMTGALAAALAASLACRSDPARSFPAAEAFELLRSAAGDDDAEWPVLMGRLESALEAKLDVATMADHLGCERGVGGYIYRSVPVSLYAWMRHWGDFRSTVSSAIACGGDTDSVGALAGALAGATVGQGKIPSDWLEGILEWPRTAGLFQRAGERLVEAEEGGKGEPVGYFLPGVLPRNILFLSIVLAHGIRRMLPPYG